jgi:hypothetical protein
MKKRRKFEHCEPAVEEFLKANPRFGTDDWYVQWCRSGNGGDPSGFLGPFREDQLYLDVNELMVTYPAAGMALFGSTDFDTGDLFFPVIWGALLAYRKSDGGPDGMVYFKGEWHRMNFPAQAENGKEK